MSAATAAFFVGDSRAHANAPASMLLNWSYVATWHAPTIMHRLMYGVAPRKNVAAPSSATMRRNASPSPV